MKALIITDVQNDFLPGGALAVTEGDKIIPLINAITSKFDLVVATKDWHPADHESFASIHGRNPGEVIDLHGISQVLWPVHCVQGTRGAELSPDLLKDQIDMIFFKGTNRQVDSYSCFFENDGKSQTGLNSFLIANRVTAVFICGLATDYCVKYSAMDSIKLGFETYLIKDASRAVNIRPDDEGKAIDDMVKVGVRVVTSGTLGF